MRTFNYVIGMTEEQITEKVKEMITHMKTDEFWLEHGGNAPYFVEGGELMTKYLEMTDIKNIERRDTLIVPYNRILRANTSRPYIENRTIDKRTVKVVMMSGREFEVSLAYVETYADIISAVVQFLTPERVTRISILDGERVLSSSSPRLILTEDSLVSVILSNDKK